MKKTVIKKLFTVHEYERNNIYVPAKIIGKIPLSLLEFIERVRDAEIKKYSVFFMDIPEGECGDNGIWIGLTGSEERTKALFLHEVAHCSKIDENEQENQRKHILHTKQWRDKYLTLCKKYNVTVF